MKFGFFPHLIDHPKKIRYQTQEKDEMIELFIRQHGIVNVPWIVTVILAAIIPVLIPFIDQMIESINLGVIPIRIVVGALVIWYMLILAYAIEKFLFWYFNIYIITNYHLVDINFFSLLLRDITEAELNDIQSVSSQISGIFGSLFNFGEVVAETAAKGQKFILLNVPRPDLVADRIQDLRAVYLLNENQINQTIADGLVEGHHAS